MAILLDGSNRVIVQGGTGADGAAQVGWMRAAGTNVVGYVSPGRGGTSIEGLPVFDLVSDAVAATDANSSIVYVPAAGACDAIIEAADAGLRLSVVAAELVPVHDTVQAVAYARSRGLWIVGPNTVGIGSPGKAILGSIAADFTKAGPVGLMSRSGTMGLMMARSLTRAGCGQTTVVHVGGDAVVGRAPKEYLELFLKDDSSRVIVYVGEIGGGKEYEMLDLIRAGGKTVIAIIVGRHAPVGKRMGHAGALVGGERETAAAKRAALRDAGVIIADSVSQVATETARVLERSSVLVSS